MKADIANDLQPTVALVETAINTDTSTPGASVDTADFEAGIMFAMAISNYSAGDFQLVIQESDDDGGSDPWTNIGAENYTVGPDTVSADTGSNPMVKAGAFSTKQFLRPVVVSTNSGDATAAVFTVMKAELRPTPTP